MDKVSVIMSAYNERIDWLEKSIDSIVNQTYRNIEFIIVLDNPDNKEILRYLEMRRDADDRIKLIVNEENKGLVYSLNRALEEASGQYIARMDADDISCQDRISHEIDFMNEHNLDFVMSNIDYIDEEGQPSDGVAIKDLIGDDFASIEKYANMSTHPTWLARAEVFRKLNGYRMVRHCEDYDFVLRAIQSGYRIGKMSDMLLHYRTRSTGVSRSNIAQQFYTMRVIRNSYRKKVDLTQLSENDWCSEYNAISETAKKKFEEAIEVFWKAKEEHSVTGIMGAYLKSHYFRVYFWDNICNNIWVRIRS